MHALLSDPATAAGQRAEPTVIAVSGLLRELILALTGTAQRPGTGRPGGWDQSRWTSPRVPRTAPAPARAPARRNTAATTPQSGMVGSAS